MDGFRTIGQPAAAAAVRAMLASRVPHAVLLAGPPSVGKHVLAMDLAAGLLCTGATGGGRPCRACRGCRMVEHGNHPDLHRLAPAGPGGQIRIGEDQHPEPGTVRRLAIDLALLPVEGGQRVAVIRDAHRMNEVAQSALLKTLEEPPPHTTLVLCADDEELLLPTIRSRCARVRLGPVGVRDIERLLGERELAEPPAAARLARLSGGRPGVAVAYASAPGAEAIRAELARTLLDALRLGRAARLGLARELQARALELGALLGPEKAAPAPAGPAGRSRGRGGRGTRVAPGSEDAAPAEPDEGGGRRASPADRRRAVALVLEAWRDVARDLACVQRGATGAVRATWLLEDLASAAAGLPPGAAGRSLARLVRAGELVELNVTPELLLDVLLVRWPDPGRPGRVPA